MHMGVGATSPVLSNLRQGSKEDGFRHDRDGHENVVLEVQHSQNIASDSMRQESMLSKRSKSKSLHP